MDRNYSEQEVGTVASDILACVTSVATSQGDMADGVGTSGATVLALSGDLGAGKTTLTKAIAQVLGVQETVISPTFVIAKYYECTHPNFDQLVHIDAYRIDEESEHHILNWQAISEMPRTLIIVEWPERITALLPQRTYYVDISHGDGDRVDEHNRHIVLRSRVSSASNNTSI